MSLLISPVLQIVIYLIHEFVSGTNPLTIEWERILGLQPETEEGMDNLNVLSDSDSKPSVEFPPILNIVSLALGNGEQKASPQTIRSSHWLS
jgi:hypothetical protein